MSDSIQVIMAGFQNFDRNMDGDPAIIRLNYADFEQTAESIPQDGRLVLVLVEARLLEPVSGAPDLVPRLLRLKGDLRAEGFFNRFLRTEVYRGPHDQDGRTILALRSFLREVRIAYPNFVGTLLLGSFPEATLVRRTVWRLKRRDVQIGSVKTQDEPFLAIEPSIVASRAEIVLADLNGNWESVYHESPLELESIVALPDLATSITNWPVNGGVFSSTAFNRKKITFADFFWVQDDDYEVLYSLPGQLQVFIRSPQRDPELSATDRSLPNPIARPDIIVSRVNARNVAVNPDPEVHGDDGTPPLDPAGRPQKFSSVKSFDTGWPMFHQDPVFERQLLCDYLDRNHRFRVGAFADLPFRAAAIAHRDFSADWAAGYLGAASTSFQPPVVTEKATALEYVKWFKQPAVIRYVNAHASAAVTQFVGSYNIADLEQEVGGRPFRWKQVGNCYEPSLEGQGFWYKGEYYSHACWFLHRTCWTNQLLVNGGANFIVHGGCSVMTAPGEELPVPAQYYEEQYAPFQNAESLLFYMNGLALMARAKDFNDDPTGLPAALAQSPRAHFGDGWKAFFDGQSNDAELLGQKSSEYWESYTIRSKKAYWWSMIGDWTVRLRYRAGLGILGFDPQFRALAVHPDQAWIDGWNFDATGNTIRAAGDLDGDGTTEFLITSDWGIGILKHDGYRWRQILVAPNGTRFDGFLLNTPDDHFGPVADFNGDGKAEIFVSSAWGIGILALAGNTLHTLLLAPNGTRFDGFLLNTADEHFGPVADFDGDGRCEMLVTSAWGIGILALAGNTLHTLLLAPNGTRFDGFLLNTADDHFGPVADFDGDGRHEMLVTSAWGIGILAWSKDTLTTLLLEPNGTRFDGFLLNTADEHFGPVADFDGDGRHEMLVTSAWGIGILAWSKNTLTTLLLAPNGTRFDGFLLNTADEHFDVAADFDGDRRDEILVTSAWGIGILALDKNTMRPLLLAPNGSHLGDWILERNDCPIAVCQPSGSGVKSGLLLQRASPCAMTLPGSVPALVHKKVRLGTALVSFALE